MIFCDIYENKLTCSNEADEKFLEADSPLSDIPKKNPKKVEVPGHPGMAFTGDTESVGHVKAVRARLQKDKPKYLAVAAAFIGVPRTNFYVYDEKGLLVYHEILPEDAETIAAIPPANAVEEIVIGGKTTIWKFAAAN